VVEYEGPLVMVVSDSENKLNLMKFGRGRAKALLRQKDRIGRDPSMANRVTGHGAAAAGGSKHSGKKPTPIDIAL